MNPLNSREVCDMSPGMWPSLINVSQYYLTLPNCSQGRKEALHMSEMATLQLPFSFIPTATPTAAVCSGPFPVPFPSTHPCTPCFQPPDLPVRPGHAWRTLAAGPLHLLLPPLLPCSPHTAGCSLLPSATSLSKRCVLCLFLASLFKFSPHFSPPSSGLNLLHGKRHSVSRPRVVGCHGVLPSGLHTWV